MKSIDQLYQEHSDAIDAIASGFTHSYQKLVDTSSAKLGAELSKNLKLIGNRIAMTASNRKLLSSVDDSFQRIMDGEGYQDLLENYSASFNGQFEWFNKVLANISASLDDPLPAVDFTKGDMAIFDLQKTASRDIISGVVEKTASRAKVQALQAIGGLDSKQLTAQLTDTFGKSVSEAQSLADTSISTFYRTITDKGFQIIEEDLPGFELRYNYNGPLDRLNRPFCLKLERQSRDGKTWKRAEINKMNNGQIPNVFTTCGGYRCRHQWMISVADLNAQRKGKEPPQRVPRNKTIGTVGEEISARRALHSKAMQKRLGVPHPQEQIAAIRSRVEQTITQRRAARV